MDFPSHWLRNLLFLYERGYPPLTKDEWHKLTFRIKRGKNYKDYKFLKQQVQEENI